MAGVHILEEGGPADRVMLLLEGSVAVSANGQKAGILPKADGSERNPFLGDAARLLSLEHMGPHPQPWDPPAEPYDGDTWQAMRRSTIGCCVN